MFEGRRAKGEARRAKGEGRRAWRYLLKTFGQGHQEVVPHSRWVFSVKVHLLLAFGVLTTSISEDLVLDG